MCGNQPESLCGESYSIGDRASFSHQFSSRQFHPFFTQPLLAGRVFASSAVLIGSQIILFIMGRFLGVKSIPILDSTNQQTVQMPLSELQDFLRWTTDGSRSSTNLNTMPDGINRFITTDGGVTGGIAGILDRGFPTPESPEAPMVFAVYVLANFSNKPFSPYVLLTVPILTFPGLRGALPLLIVSLLATIFVRAVVPPESTGAKPLASPSTTSNNNLTLTPNDLLKLLMRFGKHFGSN